MLPIGKSAFTGTPLSTGNIYSITVTASGPSGIITFSNYLFSLPT